MQLAVIVIGQLLLLLLLLAITRKNEFSDDYEIDFEERHRGNFVNRFKTDFFDFRNHID